MYDIHILDENYESVYQIDSYESILWVERYDEAGDFEIYTPITDYLIEVFSWVRSRREKNIDSFAWLKGSEAVMIIEEIEMGKTERGSLMLKVNGRSLESMLERRIIWRQSVLHGRVQKGLEYLMKWNVMEPNEPERKIPGVIFDYNDDPEIEAINKNVQYTGDNLYEVICETCLEFGLGFKMTLTDDGKIAFRLYKGEDRSYEQTKNPFVIFSPKFENLLSSNLQETTENEKNVALVLGEDSAGDRRRYVVGTASGLGRRELYVDARDIQSEYYDDNGEQQTVPDDEYNEQLKERGTEKLLDYKFDRQFEAELESVQSFIYGQDFFMGDIVQVETEYGIASRMRIVELVRSMDLNGYTTYPTFRVLDEEGGDK